MKVFRTDNNKPISLEYEVFDNLQIGLSSYLKLDIKDLMQIKLEKLEDNNDIENNMFVDFEVEFKKMNIGGIDIETYILKKYKNFKVLKK